MKQLLLNLYYVIYIYIYILSYITLRTNSNVNKIRVMTFHVIRVPMPIAL